MDRPRWNPLNPEKLSAQESDVFFVRISKPGPRGGRRPPLWEGYVRAGCGRYSTAVRMAEAEFLSTTKTEVSCG